MDVFNQQARVLVHKLERCAGQPDTDIDGYITLCALDIICETAMGKPVDAQNNEESDYVKAYLKSVQLMNDGIFPFYNFPILQSFRFTTLALQCG